MDPYRLHTILNELSRLDKDKAKLLDELEAAIQPQHMKVGPGSFDVRFTPPESPTRFRLSSWLGNGQTLVFGRPKWLLRPVMWAVLPLR